ILSLGFGILSLGDQCLGEFTTDIGEIGVDLHHFVRPACTLINHFPVNQGFDSQRFVKLFYTLVKLTLFDQGLAQFEMWYDVGWGCIQRVTEKRLAVPPMT